MARRMKDLPRENLEKEKVKVINTLVVPDHLRHLSLGDHLRGMPHLMFGVPRTRNHQTGLHGAAALLGDGQMMSITELGALDGAAPARVGGQKTSEFVCPSFSMINDGSSSLQFCINATL